MSMPAEAMTHAVDLNALLDGLVDAPSVLVHGIATDSRLVAEGDVFLACQGLSSQGLDYLEAAQSAGAVAVVWDHPELNRVATQLPSVRLRNLDQHIGKIANRWFNCPSRDVRVTGVTGTNGKTTTAYLIQQCLGLLKKPCGYIGTLGTGIEAIESSACMTTPGCVELHAELDKFRQAGARDTAMEVSSHAIDQERIDGVQFDAAIFTNLSRDHIDYHGSMREYFETKARLFLEAFVPHRIVNIDDEYGAELARRCGPDVVTISVQTERAIGDQMHVFVRDVLATPTGSKIRVATSWGDAEFFVQMPGEFNVANAIAVFALLMRQGVSLADACRVLGEVTAPPGRMQLVETQDDALPTVYVDYSHTPASLEAALIALRNHTVGKLWCVFGCGGDRDKGKRPMMGEVADRLADVAVVTSDNPRTEDPEAIVADILVGMRAGAKGIVDRSEAIAFAIYEAASSDTILVAGKGHEDYQIIGTEQLRFFDTEVAAEHLAHRHALSVSRS